jgi:hypothetical protein
MARPFGTLPAAVRTLWAIGASCVSARTQKGTLMNAEVESDTEDPIYWASIYRSTAVNFRLSAEKLLPSLELKPDGTPAKLIAIPFYFLITHSVELFLKSALLKRGYVPSDLKRFDLRHDLLALLKCIEMKGLPVTSDTRELIAGLAEQHRRHLLRYHLSINPFLPAPSRLWPMLDELLRLTAIATFGK